MLNENFAVEKKEGQSYDPIPENVYQVELLDISLKDVKAYKSEEMEKVMDFQFVILSGKDKDGTTELRGRNIWRNYVPTYLYIGSKNGKNVLYSIIETFLKRELTQEEEATLEIQKLNSFIGKQCRIVVKNNVKGDKTYSNIDNFLPAESDLTPLTAEEKEKATIKDKDEAKEETPTTPAPPTEKEPEDNEIVNIPF